MFKIQRSILADPDKNGREVSITIADHPDIDQASETVTLGVRVQTKGFAALEKIQIDALRRAANLLDQVANAIAEKYDNRR